MRLNLGACDRIIPGFVSVDIAPPADIVADLAKPWPWLDSSADEVVAYDVIEHIADRIHFMNELHRVLKPCARATVETPNAAKGAGYFQDPTHVSPWCLNSFQYFEAGSFATQRLAKSYGITARFRMVSLTERKYQDTHEEVWKITAVLEAVK
jgi:2-polyprenyl-3-methyl-5-hydroxy-6-metoxy-1,4-benzoquinol methylase